MSKPLCDECGELIEEDEGWTTSRSGRLNLHSKCCTFYFEGVPCTTPGCFGQSLKRYGKNAKCLMCRANATSKILNDGRTLSEQIEHEITKK